MNKLNLPGRFLSGLLTGGAIVLVFFSLALGFKSPTGMLFLFFASITLFIFRTVLNKESLISELSVPFITKIFYIFGFFIFCVIYFWLIFPILSPLSDINQYPGLIIFFSLLPCTIATLIVTSNIKYKLWFVFGWALIFTAVSTIFILFG